jgi:LuxR family transcriptional regulator, maltose regulon positive regulatory protein
MPGLDLNASKLRPPPPRAGTIRRSSLITQLAQEDSRPIVSVVAPPGYGKTTLLSQWAGHHEGNFAWVSADEKDNDPKVLLSYVAAALNGVQPIGQRVFEALASPVSSVPGSVVPRLGSALWSMTIPVVLILDDVHLLTNRECRDALSVLAGHVRPGSRLVLAGRGEPPLRIARLRAEGRVLEIGPDDLSLTLQDAAALLRAADVTLREDDVAVLHQRTEGWPVGLYLAALYLREGGYVKRAAVSFGGDDRLVSEYIESEFLERISRRHRDFLSRTAVLERVSAPLCEAVLDMPGSGAILADLAGSNLLLVPLDRRGEWYRYHHLFRDMLLAEVKSRQPDLIPVLQRRAANWCLLNDLHEEALDYFMAAGDVTGMAGLAEKLWLPTYWLGRRATVQRWLRWLDEQGGMERYPMVAVWASILSAAMARPAKAERWADALDRWQYGDAARPADPAAEAWAAVVRAGLCRHGAKQMLADADDAVQRFAAQQLAGQRPALFQRIAEPTPALFQGIARVLCGDLDGGDASLERGASTAEEVGAHEFLALALCERSLVAMARGEWSRAEVLAERAGSALRRTGIEESYITPLVCAVQARAAMHRGDVPAARQQLINAQRLRHALTYALPHWAVQARIELIRVHLALADIVGAKTLMREIDEVLRHRPDLGTLVGQAQLLRIQLAGELGPSEPGASALTIAELRILPMLATHLSFPEIGAEMFLSPHTVKSQAMSLYRKLGATSRSQAVTRARDIGLLDS